MKAEAWQAEVRWQCWLWALCAVLEIEGIFGGTAPDLSLGNLTSAFLINQVFPDPCNPGVVPSLFLR
jgi:hypothetical protein